METMWRWGQLGDGDPEQMRTVDSRQMGTVGSIWDQKYGMLVRPGT